MHSVKDADFLRSSEIETLLRKTTFKVFLLQLNDFDFFINLIDTFSKYNITKRFIIVLDKVGDFTIIILKSQSAKHVLLILILQ